MRPSSVLTRQRRPRITRLSPPAASRLRELITTAATDMGEARYAELYGRAVLGLAARSRVSLPSALATVRDCATAARENPKNFTSMDLFIGMVSALLGLSVEATMAELQAQEAGSNTESIAVRKERASE